MQGMKLGLLLLQLQIFLLNICHIDLIDQTVDRLGHPVEFGGQLSDLISGIFRGIVSKFCAFTFFICRRIRTSRT